MALAFGAGAASFALTAIAVAPLGARALALLPGVAFVAAVAAIFRYWGAAYAVPAAVAVLLAYDWYAVPPTHSHAFPGFAEVGYLVAYLVVAVLIGESAEYASRRADVSELARSELVGEQAALRRVATLVARGEPPDAVFAAVAEEVGTLLDVDGARVVRYLGTDEIMQLEGWTTPGHDRLPIGPLKLEGTSLATEVLRTGGVVRIDDYASSNRVVPWFVRRLGIRAGAAAPIVVDGSLWGAMLAWSLHPRSLAPEAETRLAAFTELIATAISKAASREQLASLVDEQAALRRVATLVARGLPPPDIFAAVAQEVGQLLGVDATFIGRYDGETSVGVGTWTRSGTPIPIGIRAKLDGPSVTAMIFKSGRPARKDSFEGSTGEIAAMTQELGVRSAVGTPIVVEGRAWGLVIAASREPEPLPADSESRIAAFTELVATAISNAEARGEVTRLAEEQAALRRVATLVARESSATEVFDEVAREVGLVLGADGAWMYRYDGDASSTVVATWGPRTTDLGVGTRLDLTGDSVVALVRRTGRPARIDDYTDAAGSSGAIARRLGLRSAIGAPVVVGGRPWGAITAVTLRAEPFAADAEARIQEFTELVATAISNIQAESDLAASRARIIAAADEERRRVVRDLHDGAQQRLVHTVVTLKLARRALDSDPGGAPALAEEALRHAEEATAELRELAHGILPSVLTRGGLRAGVRALASRMPVPVDEAVAVERLPTAVEATAYFVVAEALTNVAKHSQARRVAVRAGAGDGVLRVEVRDDGIGHAEPGGSGLVGLRDRLAALNGSLRVESPADGGTQILATIPLG